jgi:DNA-binding GntR family transcriptional regulator
MSKSDWAYEHIRERIITLELAPGATLDSNQLTSDLGVGKTPLREALQRLAFEKLIVIAPQKGTFVSDLSIVRLKQAFDARLLVERQTAGIAATSMTDEQLAHLRELLEEVDGLVNRADITASLTRDRNFHTLIAKASRNEYLIMFLDMLLPVTMRLWYYALFRTPEPATVLRSTHGKHMAVLDALASREPSASEDAMSDHIATFRDEVIALIMRGGSLNLY